MKIGPSTIADVGPTTPTYYDDCKMSLLVPNREDREQIFKDVAGLVSVMKEIRPCILPRHTALRHSETDNPLTEEWLFEYIGKLIDFGYMDSDEHDGHVPEWLPRMIMEQPHKFSDHMRFARY